MFLACRLTPRRLAPSTPAHAVPDAYHSLALHAFASASAQQIGLCLCARIRVYNEFVAVTIRDCYKGVSRKMRCLMPD